MIGLHKSHYLSFSSTSSITKFNTAAFFQSILPRLPLGIMVITRSGRDTSKTPTPLPRKASKQSKPANQVTPVAGVKKASEIVMKNSGKKSRKGSKAKSEVSKAKSVGSIVLDEGPESSKPPILKHINTNTNTNTPWPIVGKESLSSGSEALMDILSAKLPE